jgi:hypothetical protein
VDQPAEGVAASYPRCGEVGQWSRGDVAWVWRPQVPGPVRAVLVIVRGVLVQDRPQVPRPGDQYPVAITGLVAGIIAVPAGVLLHHSVVPAMTHAANSGYPAALISVYSVPEMIGLALAGLLIAVAGALAPASWAARSRTATAPHGIRRSISRWPPQPQDGRLGAGRPWAWCC